MELPLSEPVEPGWKEVELELLESMLPRQGPLSCPSPAYLQSDISLQSKRKSSAAASLYFVPALPGRYTFRWHGPHIDGRWGPGCASP